MKYLYNSFIFLILFSSCQNKDSVDLIIHGGTIYTVDSTNSKVESVALKNGLIYKTGDFDKIISSIDSNTRIIYLVYPLLKNEFYNFIKKIPTLK